MKYPVDQQMDRSSRIEYVSAQLLARAAVLTRLLAKQVNSEISRTEATVLSTLNDGPRRITELAELEGLAQPTTTLLVKRLEDLGLVTRKRQADDGRVVMVSLERAGAAALEDFRAQFMALLRADLAATTDGQIEALAAATETLESLINYLQQPRGGEQARTHQDRSASER
ncbi:MAG: putative transcriptional regulator [Acidimicrobiaceae bacterium]|jgi:DNA-binding MarR family transcriptional regulator|nr:putative transcriptional regulator [Acidimicrobiaceae bacterium]